MFPGRRATTRGREKKARGQRRQGREEPAAAAAARRARGGVSRARFIFRPRCLLVDFRGDGGETLIEEASEVVGRVDEAREVF